MPLDRGQHLRAHGGVEFTAAVLKGRSQYVCHAKVERARTGDALFDERPGPTFDRDMTRVVGFAASSDTGDLAGVDIGWHRDPTRIENIRDALAAEGRWGQKKSAGFYDYDEKRTPSPSPRVAEIIADFRARTNTPQHDITDEEIVERTLYPMVNEGAKILEEGIAARAGDIDIVWIYGYGWPTHRGGPMFWADLVGLDVIAARMHDFHRRFGDDFKLSPLLEKLAGEGGKFADLKE